MISRPQLWRRTLDSRDPDYDGPDEDENVDDEPPEPMESLPDYGRYDPRIDGPYHYIPPGDK